MCVWEFGGLGFGGGGAVQYSCGFCDDPSVEGEGAVVVAAVAVMASTFSSRLADETRVTLWRLFGGVWPPRCWQV